MAEPNTGMEKPDMKRLIMAAKSDPVSLSVGLSKDGGTALLMMDKIKSPKAVEKLLNGAFGDARDVRWGTGSVNTEVDPKLLRVTLNRQVGGGIARKLIKTLKGSGITKLVLQTEDGSEFDRHVSEDEEAEDGPPASVQSGPSQSSAPAAPEAKPLPPAAELQQALASLIPRIAQANPADKAELVKHAQLAGGLIKQGAISQVVVDSIERIRELLGSGATNGATATPPPSQGPAPAGPVAYAKSRLAWIATRQRVETDLNKLRDALAAEYGQTPGGTDIQKRYANRVSPVMTALDEELADALDDAVNAEDVAKRAEKVSAAKAIIGRYKSYLDSEPLIADLDDNPFVPLAIRKTVSATLNALEATVH